MHIKTYIIITSCIVRADGTVVHDDRMGIGSVIISCQLRKEEVPSMKFISSVVAHTVDLLDVAVQLVVSRVRSHDLLKIESYLEVKRLWYQCRIFPEYMFNDGTS